MVAIIFSSTVASTLACAQFYLITTNSRDIVGRNWVDKIYPYLPVGGGEERILGDSTLVFSFVYLNNKNENVH